MGAEIDAKSTQTRFLRKRQTSIHTGATEESYRLLVVLNVDGSSSSGHPSKVLIIKRFWHFYFYRIKAD